MKKNRSKKHMNRKKEIETEYKKIYEKNYIFKYYILLLSYTQ